MSKQPCPIVGVPACAETIDGRSNHRVSTRYVSGLIDGAGCLPLLVPAVGEVACFKTLLERLDGLFLTGAASNVEPGHYDGKASREGTPHDPERDATTLPLIRLAVELGVPVFAVCRGIQELNVAFGGTLHQNVHELPGKNEHRMNRSLPSELRLGPRHPVALQAGGLLARLWDGGGEVMVNSLHAQAIDRPGDGLFVEAISDDGVIEAVSMPDAEGFVLGVQWHPEYPVPFDAPLSREMFDAFSAACRARLDARDAAPSSIRAA